MNGRLLQIESLECRRLLTSGPIDTLDRDAVSAAYVAQFKPYIDVPVEWSGSAQGCVAGTVSPQSTAATLNVLNFLRNMAGVQSVELDSGFNNKAQQAALMMHAENSLSHAPGPQWACYSQAGAQGAGASNLYLGSTGPDAMVGYVEDPGSGNYPVGHRRWLLNPNVELMGIGSTSNANALYVFGERVSRPAPEWISWPPQGYVPKELVFPRWSLSREGADFAAATVHMTVHGQTIPLDLQPIVNGFAMNTLVWEPGLALDMVSAEEFTVEVRVENVRINGVATSFQYTVRPIHPGTDVVTVATAQDDRFAMPAGSSSFYFDVLANDDLADRAWTPATPATLTATIVSNPSHGSLLRAVGSPGILFYYPNAGFSGRDIFSYRVADLEAGRVSNLAYVQITVGTGASATNQPPTISSIANLTASSGTATAPIAFSIGDAETNEANLSVVATSANQTLFPNRDIKLAGSGANRTLTLTPAVGQAGSDTITVWVSDGQNTTFESFVVVADGAGSAWQNPSLQTDVNADLIVTPIDALLIINYLNAGGTAFLSENQTTSLPYIDVNGDNLATPIDVLLVINYLNARTFAGGGEGEQSLAIQPRFDSMQVPEGLPMPLESRPRRPMTQLSIDDKREDYVAFEPSSTSSSLRLPVASNAWVLALPQLDDAEGLPGDEKDGREVDEQLLTLLSQARLKVNGG